MAQLAESVSARYREAMPSLDQLTVTPRALLFISILTLLVTLLGDINTEAQSTYARWLVVLRYGGLVFTAVQLVLLRRRLMPYTRKFTLKDWRAVSNEYELIILAQEHNRGTTPGVNVESKTDSGYTVVEVDVERSEDGAIRIAIMTPPFNGRVTIRQ